MKRALFLLALGTLGGACGDEPPLHILYALSNEDSQTCPAISCSEITYSCPAVISIRILYPDEPNTPFIAVCDDIRADGPGSLCAIGQTKIPPKPLPVATMEVQIAIFPRSALPRDEKDHPICPGKDVKYAAATGFPVESENPDVPMPALGGRSYYHANDETTTVTLGCTDLEALMCESAETVTVTSTVRAFNPPISVGPGTGGELVVFAGEPQSIDESHAELTPQEETILDVKDSAMSVWAKDVEAAKFQHYACIDVLQNVGQTTATLSCAAILPPPHSIDVAGTWLPRATLDAVLQAMGLPFQPEGMTIGIVLDSQDQPMHDMEVKPSSGTIYYIQGDTQQHFTGATTGPTARTGGPGIFVSLDAPFPTEFSASLNGLPGVSALGGRVNGKATMVLLQFDHVNGG